MLLRFLYILTLALLTTAAPAQLRRRAPETPANAPTGPIPVVAAPQTHLLESLSFNSSLLNRAVHYSVYLPPDYYTATRRYPVVYLLHGYGDDETGWVQFGEADRLLDAGIKSGEIPPMIVVMPDGAGTYYVNDYQGNVRYEDMFTSEFVPFVDATFRTRAKAEYRAVTGLSMGGFGALVLAMHHPELFSACAALSAAARSDEMLMAFPDDRYNTIFAPIFSGPVKGEERLTATWKRNSPITLAKSAPEGDLTKVRWYIDCGDDDYLSPGNALLHMALLDRKIPHEYRVRDGAHTWAYWRSGLPEALKFIGQSFHH